MIRAKWDHPVLPATHTFYTRKGRAELGTLQPQRIIETLLLILPTSKGWKPESSLPVRGLNRGRKLHCAQSRMSEHGQVSSALTT